MLLAEVASSYVEMRTFQERVSYAVNNVVAQENALKITEDRYKHGKATRRDVEQARTVLEQTRATVPQYEQGWRLANNRLCVLLGRPPQDLAAMGLGYRLLFGGRLPAPHRRQHCKEADAYQA